MLLWFDGEQHALRACASAVSMRRTLREVGRIQAGSSDVVLRMSVGVHSGSYVMFLVGDAHRELVIGGSATSTVVAMEGLASADQILASPQTAALLPRGHAAPEHRTASVAFLQFLGLDDLIEQEGPSVAGRRVDELVRVAQDAVDRFQLCFLDSDVSANGGKIRLCAGAPRVVGDDEERTLLALRQIIERELPFPVQAEVNRGRCSPARLGRATAAGTWSWATP